MIYLYCLSLILFFAVLFKCASFFIEGAVGIAKVLEIPKMIVGIVFVGLATTAPEFGVSFIAAIQGKPEFALGNAIGSVICDDGVALGLAAILAPTAILVNCKILRGVGIFLLSIDIMAYVLARNGIIGRIEGIAFVIILCAYFIFIVKHQRSDLFLRKKDSQASAGNYKKLP
jgi:cation:H+ antiporter